MSASLDVGRILRFGEERANVHALARLAGRHMQERER
jgi:hypothetical protein